MKLKMRMHFLLFFLRLRKPPLPAGISFKIQPIRRINPTRARILFMFCFFLFLRFVPIILAVLVVVGTSPVGKCGFFLVGTESADGSPYFPSFILYTGNIPPMHSWKKQES